MKLFTGSVTAMAVLLGLGAIGWIWGRGPSPAVVYAADGGPSVTVAGPLPLPVTPTANKPVQISQGLQTGTPGVSIALYIVPAGKRLVVKYFSSQAAVAPGIAANQFGLTVVDPKNPGIAIFAHTIPPASSSSCGFCAPNQLIVASQPIRTYVEAGQELLATANFSGPIGANGSVFASISGYLVNAE